MKRRELFPVLLSTLLFLFFFQVSFACAQAVTSSPEDRYPAINLFKNPSDRRYGIGDGIEGLEFLGIASSRSWGGATIANISNTEEQNIKTRGGFSYFVVGKSDNKSQIMSVVPWAGQPRCKRSATDTTEVKCVDVPNTGIPLHTTFDHIPTLAAKYPGAIWEIANEPDLGIIPEGYAVWYQMFYRQIKKYDAAAKVMIGGMVACCGDNVWTWAPVNMCNAYKDCRFKDANDRYWWIKTVRQHYKNTYGIFPPIDIWNIHPYVFTSYQLDPSQKAATFKALITDFRSFLGTINEGGKPLYLTEFGILGNEGTIATLQSCPTHGCLTQEQYEYEWQKESDYMNEVTSWLETANVADKWFWYHWGPEYIWNGFQSASNMNTLANSRIGFLTDVTVPNPLAIAYAKKAKSPLVFNTSFEAHYANQKPYGWNPIFGNSDANAGYSAAADYSIKQEGTKSLKLHIGIPGTYGSTAWINQTIPSPFYAGKTVRLSAWCYTQGAGTAGLKINYTNATERVTYWPPSYINPSACTSWRQLKTSWVTLPADAKKIEIEGIAGGQNGDIWFDNFEFSLAGDLDKSLYVDGNDATQLLKNWGTATTDINSDAMTNAMDFGLLSKNFLK